jgi:folate-binding protein YgfZ
MAERAVVEVAGPEAREFLHSLLSADIQGLEKGQGTWAGLLTPQGKILFDMFVWAARSDEGSEGFLLDVSAKSAESFVARLNMYKLRRAVEAQARPDMAVLADATEEEGPCFAFGPDPRWAEMGTRAITLLPTAQQFRSDSWLYHQRRIALGLPDSDADIGSGKLFPHEANFDQLGAVSFSKGCYVGQEVVSRMHHRGTARSRLIPVATTMPVAPGTSITAGGKRIGEITSVAESGTRAMALVRLDRAAEAEEAGTPPEAQGGRVLLIQPPWADFEVPGGVKLEELADTDLSDED